MSTSSFSSPSRALETAFSVSCFGLISTFTAHQASTMSRPVQRQKRFMTRLGEDPSLPHLSSLRPSFLALSIM